MAFKMKRPMFAGTAAHKSALKHVISMREADKHDHPHEEETVSPKEKPEAVADPGKGSDIAYEGEKSKPIIKGDKELTKPDKKSEGDKKSDKPKKSLKDMPFGSKERIEEYDRRGWKHDETTHPKKKEEKKEEPKKEEPKKEVKEKVDTSGDSKADKISKGDTSGAEKASGRMKPGDKGYAQLPESEKLKIQKAAKAKHRKALEAWRSGGKKGKRPQRKDYF